MFSRRSLIKTAAVSAFAPWFASAALAGDASSLKKMSRTTLTMGTLCVLTVYAPDEETGNGWLDAANEELERLASVLTLHEEGSPLRNVIRHSGEAVEVPPEAAEVVEASLRIAEQSGGAFEPTIGKLVDVWKIGFGGEHVPPESEIKEALKAVGWRKVEVTRRDGKSFVRIAPGQDIDVGGIAKGYIGTKLTELLEKLGVRHGILNLGGNISLIGGALSGGPWRIGLQHPNEVRNGFFAVLSAEGESVVTSGAYERNFTENGHVYGHILSSKTGYPVKTDLASVTIVDRDGSKADAWCTAFFAMGSRKAVDLLRRRPDIEAVLMGSDCRTIWMTPGAAKRCTVTDREIMERIELVRDEVS